MQPLTIHKLKLTEKSDDRESHHISRDPLLHTTLAYESVTPFYS